MKSIIILAIVVLMSCHQKNNSTNNDIVASMPTEKITPQKENISIAYCMGQFDPTDDDRFVTIEDTYANRSGMRLRKEAYTAYLELYRAAKKDGISLIIKSATRNFDYQKGIWERKWTGKQILSDGTNAADIADLKKRALEILQYSSMPGTSRHHWGTDIDLNAFNNGYFESGEGLKVYNWLTANAPAYGFCQPYTSKSNGRTGYNEEKWHWSYMPLSKPLTQFAEQQLKNENITGFLGADTASDIDVVHNYVLGIADVCR